MDKSRNLLASAKQFTKINAGKAGNAGRSFTRGIKSAKVVAGIRGLRKAITDRRFLAMGAGVVALSGGVAYTQTIGLSAWLAEKVLNLPANLLKITTGLVTLPFAVTERVIRSFRKTDTTMVGEVPSEVPLVTVKPYKLIVRLTGVYKQATNYFVALFVRSAMDPAFRLGMKAALLIQTAMALYTVLVGGVAILTALNTLAASLVVTFLVLVSVWMLLVGIERLTGVFGKTGEYVSKALHAVLGTPMRWIDRGMTKVFGLFRKTAPTTDSLVEDLIAQRDLALAERDMAIAAQKEAEEAALLFKSEAERLRKQSNGYVKRDKDKQRDPRKSGNPAARAS